MSNRCPGQDMRKLTISYHPCPTCSKPVEFFSDELRTRCPNCKTVVYREQTPSCIQWCASARECLGEEVYNMIMGIDKNKKAPAESPSEIETKGDDA